MRTKKRIKKSKRLRKSKRNKSPARKGTGGGAKGSWAMSR